MAIKTIAAVERLEFSPTVGGTVFKKEIKKKVNISESLWSDCLKEVEHLLVTLQ